MFVDHAPTFERLSFRCCTHLVPYLIDGDACGLGDADQRAANRFLQRYPDAVITVDTDADHPDFGWCDVLHEYGAITIVDVVVPLGAAPEPVRRYSAPAPDTPASPTGAAR